MERLVYLVFIVGLVILPVIVPTYGTSTASEQLQVYCTSHMDASANLAPGTLPACNDVLNGRSAAEVAKDDFHIGTPWSAWALYGLAVMCLIAMIAFAQQQRLGFELLMAVPCTALAFGSFLVAMHGYDIGAFLTAAT